MTQDDGTTRRFTTGATRDTGQDKLDFDGFLSPLVLQRFAEYMHKHRHLSDGSLRDSDNWQKGMPLEVYMKSAWRHFFDAWSRHRQMFDLNDQELCDIPPPEVVESLCALLFNIQGYLHVTLQRYDEMELDKWLSLPCNAIN